MEKVRIVTLGISGGGSIAHAKLADLPLHDGASYRGLRARRGGLEFVHRSRAIFCRAVPNPNVDESRLVSSLHTSRPSWDDMGGVTHTMASDCEPGSV
jgi:hypothetical protein